jgi:hypothetical protein
MKKWTWETMDPEDMEENLRITAIAIKGQVRKKHPEIDKYTELVVQEVPELNSDGLLLNMVAPARRQLEPMVSDLYCIDAYNGSPIARYYVRHVQALLPTGMEIYLSPAVNIAKEPQISLVKVPLDAIPFRQLLLPQQGFSIDDIKDLLKRMKEKIPGRRRPEPKDIPPPPPDPITDAMSDEDRMAVNRARRAFYEFKQENVATSILLERASNNTLSLEDMFAFSFTHAHRSETAHGLILHG